LEEPVISTAKRNRLNDEITVPQVRLIDEEGENVGILSIAAALEAAEQAGVDLVEISPNMDPPVCRVMDYGKFVFEKKKQQSVAKRKQKQVQIKEIKFRPKISIHDYDFKLKHVQRFLEEGNKVKITIMLRGREKSRPEMGVAVLDRVIGDVQGQGKPDGNVRRQDWAVSALLVPVKTGGKDAQVKNPQGSEKEIPGHGEKENRPQEGQ